MNNPFTSKPAQEPVPPLSGQAGAVERESPEDAASRARESGRLAGVAECRECDDVAACRPMTRFVQEHPCMAVGLAFGLGLLAGSYAAAVET